MCLEQLVGVSFDLTHKSSDKNIRIPYNFLCQISSGFFFVWADTAISGLIKKTV